MIDVMKLIGDARKVANDFQSGDWRAGVKDSLAVLTEIEADFEQIYPAAPAVDPNAPPILGTQHAVALPLNMTGLAVKLNQECDDHEAKATKLGAGATVGRDHPLIQGFIKNILPLLIQALKFLPAA